MFAYASKIILKLLMFIFIFIFLSQKDLKKVIFYLLKIEFNILDFERKIQIIAI